MSKQTPPATDPIATFEREVADNIHRQGQDADVQALSRVWMRETVPYKYSYNFSWLGLPIIQFPQDIVAMQEIIWRVKPDLIVETGVARGGSVVFYASLLELIGGPGTVIGIDLDIRAPNRTAIEGSSMFERDHTDRRLVVRSRRRRARAAEQAAEPRACW